MPHGAESIAQRDEDRAYWIGSADDPELICGECAKPDEKDDEASSIDAVGYSCVRCGLGWEWADEADE
jgi:hypothetical protein